MYDVHEFEGHIACDSASNSEIVLPIHDGDDVIGVLDIDSPLVGTLFRGRRRGIKGNRKSAGEKLHMEIIRNSVQTEHCLYGVF